MIGVIGVKSSVQGSRIDKYGKHLSMKLHKQYKQDVCVSLPILPQKHNTVYYRYFAASSPPFHVPPLAHRHRAAYMRQWIGSALVQIMLVASSAPSQYQNQCYVVVNWTLGNKLQWHFNQNVKLFVHENASENIVCEMVAILSRGDQVRNIPYSSSMSHGGISVNYPYQLHQLIVAQWRHIDIGQLELRSVSTWLLVWITWSSVITSVVMFSGIYIRAVSRWVPKLPFSLMSLEIILFDLLQHFSITNELR